MPQKKKKTYRAKSSGTTTKSTVVENSSATGENVMASTSSVTANDKTSVEPVVSEEMVAKFSTLPGDLKKVGIITAGLLVLLVILWLIFR